MFVLSISDSTTNGVYGGYRSPYIALITPVVPTAAMVEACVPVSLTEHEMNLLIGEEDSQHNGVYIISHELTITLSWAGSTTNTEMFNEADIYIDENRSIREILEHYRFSDEELSPFERETAEGEESELDGFEEEF